MIQLLKLYAFVAPIFLAIDAIWLGVIMKGFYAREFAELARKSGDSMSPRWGAAAIVYLLIPAGIVLFLSPRVSATTPLWQAFAWGAAFGVVLYGVYDLTNLAVIDKYSLRLTLVDIAWGGTICGAGGAALAFAQRWFSGN